MSNIYQIVLKKFGIKLKKSRNRKQKAYRDYLLPCKISFRYFHELFHLIQFKHSETYRYISGKLLFKTTGDPLPRTTTGLDKYSFKSLKRELDVFAIEYRVSKICSLFNTRKFTSPFLSLVQNLKPIFLKHIKRMTKRLIKQRIKRLNILLAPLQINGAI